MQPKLKNCSLKIKQTNMLKKIFYLIAVTFTLPAISFGQIVVNSTQSPTDIVQNVLLGNGIIATNITYNGAVTSANAPQTNVTTFSNTNPTFPFSSGVLLTTGAGAAAAGPNNSGSFTQAGTQDVSIDTDLNSIANGSVTNGVFLEFDFVPSGDSVSFNYIFGSDEYPEFSPSTFNDAFGFFLSGPGITGPYQNSAVNLAVIPGTATPVTINNVGDASNTNYYVPNDNGLAYGNSIQYDGTTTLLTAVSQVQCGETYHIKMAICNVGDQSYDSGVFLEANSFGSSVVQVAVTTVSGDSTVVEGCSDANFIFTRPSDQLTDTLIINYTIVGDAIEGTDYPSLVNPITFLPGEDTIVLNFSPIQDNLDEGPEFITITVFTITECGDTIATQGTIYILDKPIITINENDPVALCANDSIQMTAVASGGFGPYTYSWNNGQTGSPAFGDVSINGPTNYIVTATDQCGFQMTDTVTITLNQTLAIDSMLQYPASACNPTGTVVGFASGFSGTPIYNWSGPGANSTNSINASVFQNLSAGWYYFTITDNVCVVNDSILLNQDLAPIANFTPSSSSGCTPLTVTFTNSSQNSTSYAWDFGNGQTANVNDLSSQTQTYTTNSVIRLIASANGCSDTTYVNVAIAVCGCTDPVAINYNPNAQLNDGTCMYPVPTVEIPNVFTPDGDVSKSNEIYFLTTTNAINVEFTIFNRWGDIVYSGSGINPAPAWDGKDNGMEVTEGVYFIQYKISGYNNQVLEGHGFLHLIRK